MPQLAQFLTVYQSQWFWLLIVLGAIYLFVGRGIVPKVEATVDDRDAKIAADLAAAEQARGEADATEEAWRTRMNEVHAEAQDAAAKAKAKAAAAGDKRIAKANDEIAAKTDAANARLAAARTSAMAAIEDVAADAARDIVAKISGGTIGDAEARRAVKGAMAHG